MPPQKCLFNFVPVSRLKAFTMKHKSYKKLIQTPMIFESTVYLHSCVLCIGLSTNPKTSSQGQDVQLLFKKQGFAQSLEALPMKKSLPLKPTTPPPPPTKKKAHSFVLATKVAQTHEHPVCERISVVIKLTMKLTIHSVSASQQHTSQLLT
jgi:hypothetical protein